MVASSKPRMTVEQFLAWAETAAGNHELVDGVIVDMAPSLVRHGAIQSNVNVCLARALAGGPCKVFIEVGIRRADVDDQWYQADVAVACSPQRGTERWLDSPVVVVEILSPSTAQHDRGTKVPDYQAISSVQDILLVSSEKRTVSHLKRHGEGWFQRDFIGSGEVALSGVAAVLSLDGIYLDTGL